jgi:hypothetical protein
MPHESAAIDVALVDLLEADATLASLLPDGVWVDLPPQEAKRFVVISLFAHSDVSVLGGLGYESSLYMVKAVAPSAILTNMRAAEQRLYELLNEGTLDVPGFMAMFREERIKHTERDDLDKSIRWFHRGGYYRVQVAAAEA